MGSLGLFKNELSRCSIFLLVKLNIQNQYQNSKRVKL